MHQSRGATGLVLLAIVSLIASSALVADDEGTLQVSVRDYESEVKLGKKVKRQLDEGHMVWGIVGNTLVVNFISEEFVRPKLRRRTSYGEQEEVQLPAGEYTLTCIGMIPGKSNTTDVEEYLDEFAFVNEDVLKFVVQPGEVTTLNVLPTIRKQKYNWALKLFLPYFKVSVVQGETVEAEAEINARTESSVPWSDYSGRLKIE